MIPVWRLLCTPAVSNNKQYFKAFSTIPSLEVRGVFLDISKTFDRLWHEGLMSKLKRLGICGKYSESIHSFFKQPMQKSCF